MTCPACAHANRVDIDVRLAQGDNLKRLHLMFGVSEAVLRKHQEEHLRDLPVKMRTNPGAVLLDLERVEEEAWTVVTLAKGRRSEGNPDEWQEPQNLKMVLAALQEIRMTKVAQVQVAKDLAIFKKDMISRDVFEKMTARILKALEAFPEAREAVESAMAEMEE